MRKNYQNQEIDTSQPVVPEQVSVALAELAGEMREGLLALAVDGSGELPVAGYELFSDTEVLGRMALDRMLGGMSDQRASRRRSSLGHRCPERQQATHCAGFDTYPAPAVRSDLHATDLDVANGCYGRLC